MTSPTPMPPDLVAGLKAAAEELRQRAMRCKTHTDCTFVADRKADALATLIYAMLAEHVERYHDGAMTNVCIRCNLLPPCPSLRLVADLVSTVLGRDLNG